MPVSSYQAQQVLAELRKRLGDAGKLHTPDPAVRVSTVTILEEGEEPNPARRVAPPVVAGSVADDRPYPAAVERELERRAGSFMQPSVPPRDPAKPIPKTARLLAPTPPRSLGEGD